MQYKGELYGRAGGKYFPLCVSAEQVDSLIDACRAFIDNTERWIETGKSATPSESKKIYKDAKNALLEITGENESPVIVEVYPFDEFWNDYDKKVGDKGKLIKKWAKIPDKERVKIKEYIPLYKQAQPEKKFRKNPETFLNNKSWNDELIYSEKKRGISDNYKQSILNRLRSPINPEVMQEY